MNIRTAVKEDLALLSKHDKHIAREELCHAASLNRVYIVEENNRFIGWLRYNLFWDNTPFMNMIYLLEEYREKGYGKKTVKHWEEQMKAQNYDVVMTSTASDEYAQHFYVKLGYRTIGGFTFQDDPYEIILMKEL